MPRDHLLANALVRGRAPPDDAAVEIGLARDKIILSAKVSQVQDLIAVYTELAQRSDHAEAEHP